MKKNHTFKFSPEERAALKRAARHTRALEQNLWRAFYWADTKQGADYWGKVTVNLDELATYFETALRGSAKKK